MRGKKLLYEILNFLPPNISGIINSAPKNIILSIEEIRLRSGKPLMICGDKWDSFLDVNGNLVKDLDSSYFVTKDDVNKASELIQRFSSYSFDEELRNGFITIPGGHRIGISGKVVMENGSIRTMKNISFINYRIARAVTGAADKVMRHLIGEDLELHNTIIVSPPQCGKTTILRDIVRQLSSGIKSMGLSGMKVGLIDERSEVAACFMGEMKNDVGPRTDVLDGCPKAKGIIIMIRSMSPEVIATDEIGKVEDADALLEAANAGVKVIATMHGKGIEDFERKVELKKIHNNLFERVIVLSRSNGVGTIEFIFDEKKNILFQNIFEARSRCL